MKKLITILGCAVGFFLIAAPIYMENPVFINGKPFATALNMHGIIVVAVQDFAKAVGAGGTVQIQGNRLAIISPRLQASASADTVTKVSVGTGGDAHAATGGAGAGTPNPAGAAGGGGTGRVTTSAFTITKTINTASPLIMNEGKAYISLTDVAHLFGGNFNNAISGNLRPGQRIDLNFAPSPGAAIAVH